MGLKFAEQFEVLVHVAGDALFVEREVVKASVVFEERERLSEAVADAGMLGIDFAIERGEFRPGEHVVFDGFDFVEAV